MDRVITVLFARKNSIYKRLPGVDVWDEARDALKWEGGTSVIAHPPCRLWCACKSLSRAPANERNLSIWAVDTVQHWGGVLEHPARSGLWEYVGLPLPGRHDAYGFSIAVDQWWWDHKASKRTWLYVCGAKFPEIPLKIGEPTHLISNSRTASRN